MMNKRIVGIFAGVCIFFFCLNLLIPFMSDDYVFCYRFFGPDIYSNLPIRSVADFMDSLKSIYLTHNGRIIVHGLMLLFCSVTGKGLFNIVNTIAFGYAIYLTWKLIPTYSNRKQDALWRLLPVILFYTCLLPAPGDTLFWVSGAINYLWTTTFCLFLLYLIEHKERFNTLSPLLCVLLGLVGAQSHELLSISFSGALLWMWIREPRSTSTPLKIFIISFWIASASVVLAPGIISRATGSGLLEGTLLSEISSRIAIFMALSIRTLILPILFLGLLLFILLKGRAIFGSYLKKNQLLFILLAINLTFLFVMKTPFFRAYYMASVFAFLLLARSFEYMIPQLPSRIASLIAFGCCCAILFASYQAFGTCRRLSQYDQQLITRLKNSPEKAIIPVEEFTASGRFVPSAFIVDKSRYHFTNRYLSFYYGKEYVQFIPQEVFNTLQQLQADSAFLKRSENLSLAQSGNLFLIPIHEEQIEEEADKIAYFKNESSSDTEPPFYKKIFRSLLGADKMVYDTYFTIPLNQQLYMVFPRKEGLKKIRVPFKEKETPYYKEYVVIN